MDVGFSKLDIRFSKSKCWCYLTYISQVRKLGDNVA